MNYFLSLFLLAVALVNSGKLIRDFKTDGKVRPLYFFVLLSTVLLIIKLCAE